MTSPFRMITTVTSILLMLIAIFYLFLNTSLDDQRSNGVRQIATVNLNRKATRLLPNDDNPSNQATLAHYSLKELASTNTTWNAAGASNVTVFEQSVWNQLYAKYGDKIEPVIKQTPSIKPAYGEYKALSRTVTFSKKSNANTKGTIVFSYLYKSNAGTISKSLDDVYTVKVQAIISGRSYSTNLAIIHDNNNNNFGLNSGQGTLPTQVGSMTGADYKSGATIAQTFTTDTGYNVVWDTEFVQKPIKGMDHIRLTYTFNQEGQAVTVPKTMDQIYSNGDSTGRDSMTARIYQSNNLDQLSNISQSNVVIKNSTSNNAGTTVVVTLTRDQSAQFMNVPLSTQQKLLFRVYSHISNIQLKTDYASAQAKLETLDSNGNVLYTQTSDESKIRVTPFAIQPIDTSMKQDDVKRTLTTYINKMYGSNLNEQSKNNTLAVAQYDFAKAANTVVAVRAH